MLERETEPCVPLELAAHRRGELRETLGLRSGIPDCYRRNSFGPGERCRIERDPDLAAFYRQYRGIGAVLAEQILICGSAGNGDSRIGRIDALDRCVALMS